MENKIKTKKSLISIFLLITMAIYGLIYFFTEDVAKDISLGLDLQGGFEVLYEVSPIDKTQEVTPELLSATVSSLNKRIDALGVAEPSIQIEGEDRIRVQLAGVENQQEAREMLSTSAKMTFRDINDEVVLDGSALKEGGANVTFSETNTPWVSIQLKDAKLFKEATTKTQGSVLAIWMDYEEGDTYETEIQKADSKIISAPYVGEVLNTKDVVIQGTFSMEEATLLSDLLNSGSLPVDLEEIYSNSVSAQFGEKALEQTILAGAVALALIFLYMLVFYRFNGLIAVITLSLYTFLTLLVFDWMNAVLTLPGIAALILGVGMALDANIITSERIKDEIKDGLPVKQAIKNGSKEAFVAILDSNLTTLIAAGVLFAFGTSSVKGFAIMLILSILMSFLTAVYGSRFLMGLWAKSGFLDNKQSWLGVNQKAKGPFTFRFVENRKKFLIASLILIVISFGSVFVKGVNLGVDFTSGTRVDISTDYKLTEEKVKSYLDESNLEYAKLNSSKDEPYNVTVTFNSDVTQEQVKEFITGAEKEFEAHTTSSEVSPQVGKELIENAIKSLLIAALGIILYLAFRFEWLKGLATITGVLFNVLVTIGLFSILGLEIDVTFIAAILTVVGYSINDTIVTFDRIRDKMKGKEKEIETFEQLAKITNDGLNETLTRSINTGITVFIAVFALIFLGSPAIFTFSMALAIGLLAGMYTSIFLAAQLWAIWKFKQIQYRKANPKEEYDIHDDKDWI